MYNDYNDQNRSDSEYHYSYRSDDSGFQPEQTPAPVTPKKNKRGRAGKAVALVLCGALLIGGGFGAGWYLNNRDDTPAASVSGEPPEEENRDGQIQISSREKAPATTVSVTGGEKLTFPQVYKANVDSCVSINVSSTKVGYNIFGQPVQREAVSSGSGFILTADGYIVTNCHVVSGATGVQVTLDDGTVYSAEVVGSDADYDIAVLKVDPGDTKLKPVVLGSSDSLEVGEEVSTIGNPLGELTFSLTHGIVSCLDREINLDGTPFNMIQVDTAINPGNSGGPLFNSYGEVVGIVTAKTSSTGDGTAAEGLGFAIPINDVLHMIKDIMENGRVTSHAYMGVTPIDAVQVPQSGLRSGAYMEVVEGGPAEKAGLQTGDVITMVDTETITSANDLRSAVGSKSYQSGDKATITYVRNGKVYTTDITFGSTTEMPEEEAVPQSAVQPDNGGYDGSYGGYGYGSMEDFFNEFFGGGYGRQAA